MKKILYIFLSLILVYATTANSYAVGSSWSVTKAVSNGASTVISATKGGYKNVVTIAPTASRVGLQLLKRGNQAALLYAATQLLLNGIDFVMDDTNLNYTELGVNPALEDEFAWGYLPSGASKVVISPSKESAARSSCTSQGFTYDRIFNDTTVICYRPDGVQRYGTLYKTKNPNYNANPPKDYPISKSIPLSSFANSAAPQVIANAAANSVASTAQRAAAQVVTSAAAVAQVIAGDYDSQLQSGAVPNGSDNSTATGSAGLAAGQAAADARAASDAARSQSDVAKNTSKDAADDAQAARDKVQDLINSGADDAAIAAADAASKAADAVANAAKDAADAAADARARAADDAAARAKEYDKAARAAELRAKQLADEAAERLRDIADDATESVKSTAKELADEAAKALEDAEAVRDLAKDMLKDAELARDDAKKEASKVDAKPFELPAFCTWAAPVCDAIDFIKKDPVAVAPELVPVDDAPAASSATDFDVNYVNFGGQCPVLPSFDIGVGVNTFPMSFDMTPLCEIAVAIRPAIIAMAYFIGLGIVASSIRGT